MPRLQINLSFTAEAFEKVKEAADAQGTTVTQFAPGRDHGGCRAHSGRPGVGGRRVPGMATRTTSPDPAFT